MSNRVYRVCVEQRPDENFKRYYPQYADLQVGQSIIILSDGTRHEEGGIKWHHMERIWDGRDGGSLWHTTLKSATDLIDQWIAMNQNHIIEYIDYP